MSVFDDILGKISDFLVTSVAPTSVDQQPALEGETAPAVAGLPAGRGFWVWRLERCEGGDVGRIVERSKSSGLTWLAVKAGNGGSPWSQFTPALVSALHDAGIAVYGWSYDVPGSVDRQIDVVRRVAGAGADGFIIDAEIDWERVSGADAIARRYVDGVRNATADRENFVLGDAPWPVVKFHPRFPFAGFSGVDFRSPQNYWPENCIPVGRATTRYVDGWRKWESKNPACVRPRLSSGYSIKPSSGCRPATPDDMREFERLVHAAGEVGCLYWEWSQTPESIWSALKGTSFDSWGQQ